MGIKKFDFFSSKKFEIEFDSYFDFNMHLYIDIGDASSSLEGRHLVQLILGVTLDTHFKFGPHAHDCVKRATMALNVMNA